MKNSKIIALDCDGVLLDYGLAYGDAWSRAFGETPILHNPNAYSPIDRWKVPMLSGQALEQLRGAFDEMFWSTIPAIDGALEGCQLLVKAGYELVCVTAISDLNLPARRHNLRVLGFPISDVIATANEASHQSPKANTLNALNCAAFVDDFAPYLIGVDETIHKALILRDPEGSPNVGQALELANSTHGNLNNFARWWCEADALMEHTQVVVHKAFPHLGLSTGSKGVIVHVHQQGVAYEVEFVDLAGLTLGVEIVDRQFVTAWKG